MSDLTNTDFSGMTMAERVAETRRLVKLVRDKHNFAVVLADVLLADPTLPAEERAETEEIKARSELFLAIADIAEAAALAAEAEEAEKTAAAAEEAAIERAKTA